MLFHVKWSGNVSLRKDHLSTELNEMRVIVEGMASAKAPGQVCAQHTAGTARNSVWLESGPHREEG